MMSSMRALSQKIRTNFMSPTKNEVKHYYPESFDELKEIVHSSYERGEKIYTISKGYNWGLGSSRPTDDECSVINLSLMNKVLELNLEQEYVVIEPGVTQGQLSDLLRDTEYMIDVTGSSKDTSIVGNALERGISYRGLRADSIISLEVILGTGEVFSTGSKRFENWSVKNHYTHGVGPNLTGLFLQSNFGIVSKMTYRIFKKPKYHLSVKLTFKDEDSILNSLSAFNELFKKEIINDVFHIANVERAINAIKPDVCKTLSQQGAYKQLEVQSMLERVITGEWSASGIVRAQDKKSLKIKRKSIKKAFSSYCKVEFFSEKKFNLLSFICNVLGMKKINAFFKTIKPLMQLYVGESTDLALGSVLKLDTYINSNNPSSEVDLSSRGFSYCLPLTLMKKNNVREMLDIINEVSHQYDFVPSVTLNPLQFMVIEAVVSIEYSNSDLLRAKECIREMQKRLNDHEHLSYRTNIFDMDLYFKDESYNKVLLSLKKTFDPKGLISPGRYLPTIL